MLRYGVLTASLISIHALLAESDLYNLISLDIPTPRISIHALLAESDMTSMLLWRRQKLFLSTLSLRRATLKNAITAAPQQISIHALLAESDYDTYAKVLRVNISIHALLAESDV